MIVKIEKLYGMLSLQERHNRWDLGKNILRHFGGCIYILEGDKTIGAINVGRMVKERFLIWGPSCQSGL